MKSLNEIKSELITEKFTMSKAKQEWKKLKNKTFTVNGITYKIGAPSNYKDYDGKNRLEVKITDQKNKKIKYSIGTDYTGNKLQATILDSTADAGLSDEAKKPIQGGWEFNDKALTPSNFTNDTGETFTDWHDTKPLAWVISKYFKDGEIYKELTSDYSAPEVKEKKITKKQIKELEDNLESLRHQLSYMKSREDEYDGVISGRNWSGGSLSARDFDRYNPMGSGARREVDRRKQAQEDRDNLYKKQEETQQKIWDAEKELADIKLKYTKQ